MNIFINWIIYYCAVMFAMSIDNIFWIPTAPEYPEFQAMSVKDKLNYIIKERIWAVLKHPRDIISAVLTSSALTYFLPFH